MTPLPFDSSLFGYPVSKCLVGENWDESLFLQQARDHRLVYLFSKRPIEALSQKIALADVRLTFVKELDSSSEMDFGISPYAGGLSDQLMTLALESGAFSRFKTDPGFVGEEYQKLYRLWISKALDQEEVLVADDLAGFVTCHTSERESSIGLIAVDSRQRGMGWGKRLVKAAENFAYER